MDSIFGLVGDGYALIAADASAARSILVFKHDHDKIMQLDTYKLLAGAGTPADTSAFTEYVQKNLKLYELNNDLSLSTHGAANFVRGQVCWFCVNSNRETFLAVINYRSRSKN